MLTVTPTRHSLPVRVRWVLAALWAWLKAKARAKWIEYRIRSAQNEVRGFERAMAMARYEIEAAQEDLRFLPKQIAYHQAWIERERAKLGHKQGDVK